MNAFRVIRAVCLLFKLADLMAGTSATDGFENVDNLALMVDMFDLMLDLHTEYPRVDKSKLREDEEKTPETADDKASRADDEKGE